MAGLAGLDVGLLGTRRSREEAVVCALDGGTDLVARDSAGVEVSFPGLYGLAPEWVRAGRGGEDRCDGGCATQATGSITGAPSIGEVIATHLAGD